ncbi:MAG: hypothetical protein UY85_C0006G0007 [Candidatus Peribacteria bacterium GW2011_GWB1_54_5]|nr:MAG: hypothetical protein UY85_C0006G0007 [Candidatus Peribacteria bacterium GW2011_GWB1_54_5]
MPNHTAQDPNNPYWNLEIAYSLERLTNCTLDLVWNNLFFASWIFLPEEN